MIGFSVPGASPQQPPPGLCLCTQLVDFNVSDHMFEPCHLENIPVHTDIGSKHARNIASDGIIDVAAANNYWLHIS